MKRIISIIISIVSLVSIFSISTEAKDIYSTTNKYKANFNRYLYGDYAEDPDFVPDYETYEEVYYHNTPDGEPDWVIVNASYTPEPGMCHGIFDYVALIECPSCSPFSLGLGVYDVQADTFYSLEEAWDMDFSELHKTFLDIMSGDEPIRGYYQCRLLGDADKDGELSVIDATLIQRYDVKISDLKDDELDLGYSYKVYGPDVEYISDFNCDGERDVIDATCLQRYLVGLPYPRYK
jgi:hypothetical protein